MPTPEQVVEAMHGSDPLDTFVRQTEALRQMCVIMRAMPAGGEMLGHLSPEELAQCAAYTRESAAVEKRAAGLTRGLPKYGPGSLFLRRQPYQLHESFRSEVLSHFPKLQADYDARKRAEFVNGVEQSATAATHTTWFNFAMCAGLTLLFGAGGIAMIWVGQRMEGGPRAGSSKEKVVVRSVDGASSGLVPSDPAVVVEQFCVGAIDSIYTYGRASTVTVSGGTATVSGGGQGMGSYMTYDFGCAVHNRSKVTMRFQVALSEVDSQGYVTNNVYMWEDVSPGEKRRVWAGLSCREGSTLGRWLVKEVGFGPVTGNPRDRVHFPAATSPNVPLSKVFGFARAPLASAKVGAFAALTGSGLTLVGLGSILLAALFGVLTSLAAHQL